MDLVDRLAERWYEESQARGLATDPFNRLKRGLRDFLPGEAIAGIAYSDDQPFVLALAAEVLLLFAPPPADRQLDVVALPIASVRSLAVTAWHESTVHANYRVCNWMLRDDVSSREHQTRRLIGSGFDSDNGGETAMLAFAERLGWQTPLRQKEKK